MNTVAASEQIAEALASIPEVIGCCVLRPDRETEPGWQVFPLADGRRARVDFSPGTSQETIGQVQAIVASLAPQMLTPAQTARRRAKQLARSADPQTVLLRATLRVLFPGRTWRQIIGAIEQQIDAGSGDA